MSMGRKVARGHQIVPAAKAGLPVLGTCNGFQMLCEAHLLPGALLRNTHMRFVCLPVRVRVETTQTLWTSACESAEELILPVAHNEGNYFADPATLEELEDEERVVLRYLDNPNGSANDIAGICNEGRNIVGIMPHPERVSDTTLGSEEGLRILRSVLAGARV
jgi:phosphoribosylformylglycinamidine synthase subunit PurQ / glutaminase